MHQPQLRDMLRFEKIPSDELLFSSCSQYIQEVEHEGQGQMDEAPLNHYRQNKLLSEKAV